MRPNTQEHGSVVQGSEIVSKADESSIKIHVQSVRSSLPIDEVELAGQAKQKELEFAPAVVEYVPAEHSLHADAPVTFAYLPAPHVSAVRGCAGTSRERSRLQQAKQQVKQQRK